MTRVVVIGAGIGGLSAAAMLAKAGLDVTVLESHIYPGGCAGTFYYQGYRFDAGATLAGGFAHGGPMHHIARALGIDRWPSRPAEPAMTVHLTDGTSINRSSAEARWEERRAAFGHTAIPFWRWQEDTADAMWDLALRLPHWPPQSAFDGLQLLQTAASWSSSLTSYQTLPGLLQDAFRPASAHLLSSSPRLRQFVDAQLLISAQATSASSNALYAASALDLPRRGVVHLEGGMGAIAECLAQAVHRNGGQVQYRNQVTRIVMERGSPVAVETRRDGPIPADILIANLPPGNISRLLAEHAPPGLRDLPAYPPDAWGAFVVYLGLDGSAVPANTPLHHQVIRQEPLGEGNSIFLSISPAWDQARAPRGQRAVTISTHTRLEPWWDLFEHDRPKYEARKGAYVEKILAAAEQALPGIRDAAALVLPGTPVTFQRFTLRERGWVGGFPLRNLFRFRPPRLSENLWMVGDSIFPGQSTAAVALGGLRVAQGVLRNENLAVKRPARIPKPWSKDVCLREGVK